MTIKRWTDLVTAEDVTPEILAAAEHVFDGWFASAARIDWPEFIDRLDGMTLEDGSALNMGDSLKSPAISVIVTHVRTYAKAGN